MAQVPCRVLLIGMMGSGKSTVGRLISAMTGWPYIDNDELVRRSDGATAREILAERGEEAMRRAESAALRLGLATPAPAAIGVAAGTILDPRERKRLADGGIVVWLRADPDVLEVRASAADHRPFVDGGGESWIRDAAAERDPLYASVADVVVDTGLHPPEASARQILDRLGDMDDAACQEALRSVPPPPR